LETPPHHHLICLSCGTLFEVDDSYFAIVRDRLKQELGFTARIDHMAIYGQCAACTKQE
jgi:Fur family ferric uptake transcriptional regulator